MITGKIYKITADHTDDVYIGCSAIKYLSQRMACHRQNNKLGIGNYGDLFSNPDNPPQIEMIEEGEFEEHSMLRKREREIMETYDNAVNLRSAYLTPEEKEEARKKCVKKYQASQKGQIAMAKSQSNQKIKKLNEKIESLEEGNEDCVEELNDIIYILSLLKDKVSSS
tara:strand:- start:440 stop:943 length:504 start_codon:yes stop_codon:yes gene_type:complete